MRTRSRSAATSAQRTHDAYYTDESHVQLIIDELVSDLFDRADDLRILEPSAGGGDVVRALRRSFPNSHITCCEIRPSCRRGLERSGADKVIIGDFLDERTFLHDRFDLCMGNPPYQDESLVPFVRRGLDVADHVCYYLRLGFLASRMRNSFLRADHPDVYSVPVRFRMGADGGSDRWDRAWFHWPPTRGRTSGRVVVLPIP